jgi:FMN phosphatase YigB (HAD superfamily)
MIAVKNKTILVDCDGVLLDWGYAFASWMDRHGYVATGSSEYDIGVKYGLPKCEKEKLVRMFNESAAIRKLPPLRDAIKYVKKLHEEHGYVFHAITSLSTDQYACHLRTKNLRELFGNTAFEKYVYLDTGADKDDALLPYKNTGCFWVEDKPENVDCGINLGLSGILIAHDHNVGYDGNAVRVQNWKAIYKIIVGQYGII